MKTISVHDRRRAGSSLAVIAALLTTAGVSGTAFAQTQAAAQSDAAPQTDVSPQEIQGDIMVTARRKSENILKTPIAISALTADDIAARGIANLQDIAQSVPSLNVQSQATQGGRADRSFVGVILRGMTPSTSSAQTTSIFIDGAPVTSATALQTLTNPERVEVIKGPQSALFGRQTFAGALNIVTKAPSDHWTGSMEGSFGTRKNYDGQLEISGPIIEDVLSFRASLHALGKDGSYKNAANPSETLGDQNTKTGSLAILFKPTNNLTFKAFGLFSELNDGPSAQGVISAYQLKNAQGGTTVANQSNCVVNGHPFICGTAPGLSSLTPSANTFNDSVIQNYLASSTNRTIPASEGVDGYGLVNHTTHFHLNADWALGDSGVTLSSLTAWNSERKSELGDLDNFAGSVATFPSTTNPQGYYNYAYLVEGRSRDFSEELRASFENGGPVHASLGGSYLNAVAQTDSGGPAFGTTRAGQTQNRTFGAFGSFGYDFSSAFTLSADARYQIDKVYAFAGQNGVTSNGAFVPAGYYPEGSQLVEKTYKNFLPRVIAQYNVGSSAMFYASFSKGVNPAVFNTLFINAAPVVAAEAQRLGYQIAVAPEKISNYEIGSKGKLFSNRIHYDMAAFMAIWTNQIQSQSTYVNDPVSGLPLQVVANVNTGAVKIKGIEANVTADIVKGLSVNLAGSYIDTFILKAVNTPVSTFYGITNFRGKENPFTSKWSGTASVDYSHPINSDGLDGFTRVDFTYKSGSYADIANVVKSPDTNQVNLRIGIRTKQWTLEAWSTNLFNNKAYYNIVSSSLALPGVTATYAGLIAQLRDLRTVGLRGSVNF